MTNRQRYFKCTKRFLVFETITFDSDGRPETLESDMPQVRQEGEYLTQSEYYYGTKANLPLLKTIDGLYAFLTWNDVVPFFVEEGEDVDDAWNRHEQADNQRRYTLTLTKEAERLIASTTDHSNTELRWLAKRLEVEMRCTYAEARRAIFHALGLYREFGHVRFR